ncbi:conserved hypothetical protein [Liberibacter phage FP2]|uniref:Uncharacterized protein n=1 Tax=Liberibacter asiaticus TaxID=34021 RepID=G0XP43_LIBAS|nr:hypothetical protein [Candidatus Liberibacter asiaticus]AEL31355.1 conserved hypothetical protein [Liberibacter phage FP2]AEK98965.1 hypothetical protein [Candidatus Liberibacter asiaticus]AEK98966.1 hypothetical protein [Candidatus Liberibacter asiaticus]AEK98967.1 hypothetical protein [Candidatus Liberibacter asiaticus]AEK98970.1 hypothetical protein [Candidatus Liberibacter asiaticus]
MMQYNFEQSKDVSYRLFGSYFVIPWTVKDPSRIHAEVKYPDGNMEELSPERDFKVDVDESSLILSSKRWINNNNALRIFEGEKQTFKDFNIEVQKKVNQVNVLTQKMNTIDGIVNDLAIQTEDVGRKLEQIDLSKVEGLDPQTRKYLQDIQTQLTSDTLTLQLDDTRVDDTRGYDSSIRFKDKDGALGGSITRVVKGDITGLSIATKNKSGSLENRIKFYDDKDVYINGQCFVKGTDTSIFDEIARQLTPRFLGLLQGRTMVRSANLREKASIGDIITGDKIAYWAYPSENSSGYISASATQEHTMAVSAENARKRWRIMGKTDSYYITLYWLQEVINFDD